MSFKDFLFLALAAILFSRAESFQQFYDRGSPKEHSCEIISKSIPRFCCVEVLRPSQPNGVMSSAVSLPNHTFTGQA